MGSLCAVTSVKDGVKDGEWVALSVLTYSSSGTLRLNAPSFSGAAALVGSFSLPWTVRIRISRRGGSVTRGFVTVSPFRHRPTERVDDLSHLRGAALEAFRGSPIRN